LTKVVDRSIVDAEIIRPRSWILRNGICAGRMLPFNLPELEVSGLALVTAIDDCPPIAGGEGSVVTARFVTREVHVVASVDVLGADGTVETITGTTIHPVWSDDRQEWVPLAELADGETLQGLDGLAVVLSVSLSRVSQPVYNIEVHGEHVYQVGELGVLVHNTCPVGGIAGTRGLQHSFDSHAAQWFARHGGTPSIAKWQELIETASKSTKVVDWSTGADKTIGNLARIDGNKWFFVQFFKEGPRAGELATAFIPNADQLGAILRLIGK